MVKVEIGWEVGGGGGVITYIYINSTNKKKKRVMIFTLCGYSLMSDCLRYDMGDPFMSHLSVACQLCRQCIK